jgi:hypothetical protein
MCTGLHYGVVYGLVWYILQGVQKVTQPLEKCNINFICYYYAYFL